MLSKCTRSIIGFILTSSILTQQIVSAGVLCYKCDHLPHPRDCDTIVECGDNEYCYGDKFVSDDGLVTYNTGCRAKDRCVIQKRDTTLCAQCCDSNYCNLESCDESVTSNRKRCLSCKYSVRPEDCNLSLLCNEDENCYTQSIIHNQEKRYRLGCVHKNQCSSTVNIAMAGVGKRAITDDYCGKCCMGNNCNRDVCSQTFNGQYAKLDKPPPQTFCRDNSTTLCRAVLANDPNMCSLDYYKFYMCQFTCNQCGTIPQFTNAPVITQAATTAPTTTLDPSVCADAGANCDALVCQLPNVAQDLCRKTCGLCKGQQTTVTVTKTTVAPITQAKTTKTPTIVRPTNTSSSCEDPIPVCQCRYLNNEANICKEAETDGRLQRFCCYFCHKLKGDTTCPVRQCEEAEKIEQHIVDKMKHDIQCISGK